MSVFVNRESELNRIRKALTDLLSKDSFPSAQIIDFYGVEGIGKTSILQQVEQECNKSKVRCIKADASQPPPKLFDEIIQQANKYGALLLSQGEGKDPLDQSVDATKDLLGKGPLVILLDAVDSTNDSQLAQLEDMLDDVIAKSPGKLFVVLTSRRSIAFEHRRSVARKLEQVPLSVLDRKGSQQYIDSQGHPMVPAVRELIYEWTRGYPLAMKVMIDAIAKEGIDPMTDHGQRLLLAKIVDRVIDHGILAQVETAERGWFRTVLSLLSVPRRFNLIIMQNLIERFEPKLKLINSLAYIVLPKRITQATSIMSWDTSKAGFTIDAPVRNIFLLQLRIEHPRQYYAVNSFLADMNLRTALKVSGTDRVRYLLEYLYHSSNSADTRRLPEILTTVVQRIIQEADVSPENLVQFLKIFEQDDELKELLGKHTNRIVSPLYRELAQKMYQNALREEDEEKRFHYFQEFFDYTIQDPEIAALGSVLKENIELLIDSEHPDLVKRLYARLASDNRFKEALGKEFPILQARINGHVS